MTFAAADPIPSGLPYPIVSIDGQEPQTLDQFVGAATFTIRAGSVEVLVSGQGSPAGAEVRFQEKDEDHDGKDVRAWQIAALAEGGFSASAASAF
jgi:hypothetical protein